MKKIFTSYSQPVMVGLITTALVGLFMIVLEFNSMKQELKLIHNKLDTAQYDRDKLHNEEVKMLEKTILIKKLDLMKKDIENQK